MTKVFRELDPEQAQKLIEGYENVLLPAFKEQERQYAQAACPECGGPCMKEYLSLQHSLPKDAIVPRSGLKCERCGCVFDPHTRIIIKTTSAIAGRKGA